jgi:hypothetical protein
MSKEHSVKYELAGETGIFGENLLQCHKSHITKPGIEPGQPWWDAGFQKIHSISDNGVPFRRLDCLTTFSSPLRPLRPPVQ